MATAPMHTFDCQIYVPARGPMAFRLPTESGPTRIARLQPLVYDELVDPSFRRLLAAFESLPKAVSSLAR
jgi:hypothetical protein